MGRSVWGPDDHFIFVDKLFLISVRRPAFLVGVAGAQTWLRRWYGRRLMMLPVVGHVANKAGRTGFSTQLAAGTPGCFDFTCRRVAR